MESSSRRLLQTIFFRAGFSFDVGVDPRLEGELSE